MNMEINVYEYVSASLNVFTVVFQSPIVFTLCKYSSKKFDERMLIQIQNFRWVAFCKYSDNSNKYSLKQEIKSPCDSCILSNSFSFKWQVFKINYAQAIYTPRILHTDCLLHAAWCQIINTFEDILGSSWNLIKKIKVIFISELFIKVTSLNNNSMSKIGEKHSNDFKWPQEH